MDKPRDIETLYIDFDSFFASVEQQLVPKYRGRPMGVLPLDSPYSGFIALSREAKAIGIKRGHRLMDVREKYPDFPAPVARHDVYVKIHHKMLDSVGRCVPIHKVWSVDEVECRLKANERADWLGLAVRLRDQLARDLGPYITPSIGFGPNQVLAKIAAEMDKPNGLVCIAPYELPHILYDLSLSDIPGIGFAMEHRLRRAGIGSVSKLMSLSGKQMRALWRSVEGERLWAGLHGFRVEPSATVRGMFGHGRVLSPTWRNRTGARHCARLLLVKAVRRMRRENYAAKHCALSVQFRDRGHGQRKIRGERYKYVIDFEIPAMDDAVFLNGLEQALAAIWAQCDEGAGASNAQYHAPLKIGVTVYGLVGQSARMPDLFESEAARCSRLRWETLSTVMDGVNSKYKVTVLSVGSYVEPPGGYAGGKIAFGRIPDPEDFV